MAIVYWYIRDFFGFIFEIFSSIMTLLYNLILVLIECGKFVISLVGHLPLIISGSAVIIVIVCLLYKVLGREGGQ